MLTAHPVDQNKAILLHFLARSVRATAEQCTRHPRLPATLRLIRQDLNELHTDGLVDVYKGFSQTRPPHCYSPTMRGWRYANERYGTPIPWRWRPSEARLTDFDDYRHDLAITDVGLQVERFCFASGELVRLEEFRHDRFLPQTRVTLPDGTQHKLRLDAFIDLRIQRSAESRTTQRCLLVEIDRSEHFTRALTQKLLAQYSYAQGAYQTDFRTRSLTYLWVCPEGTTRVTSLVKLAERLLTEHSATEYAPLFLFTPADPAATDPLELFTGNCWFTPFQAEPVSLLGFTPEVWPVQRSHYTPQAQYEQIMGTPSSIGAEVDED